MTLIISCVIAVFEVIGTECFSLYFEKQAKSKLFIVLKGAVRFIWKKSLLGFFFADWALGD